MECFPRELSSAPEFVSQVADSHFFRNVFFPGLKTLNSVLGRNTVLMWLSWKDEVVHL